MTQSFIAATPFKIVFENQFHKTITIERITHLNLNVYGFSIF